MDLLGNGSTVLPLISTLFAPCVGMYTITWDSWSSIARSSFPEM